MSERIKKQYLWNNWKLYPTAYGGFCLSSRGREKTDAALTWRSPASPRRVRSCFHTSLQTESYQGNASGYFFYFFIQRFKPQHQNQSPVLMLWRISVYSYSVYVNIYLLFNRQRDTCGVIKRRAAP